MIMLVEARHCAERWRGRRRWLTTLKFRLSFFRKCTSDDAMTLIAIALVRSRDCWGATSEWCLSVFGTRSMYPGTSTVPDGLNAWTCGMRPLLTRSNDFNQRTQSVNGSVPYALIRRQSLGCWVGEVVFTNGKRLAVPVQNSSHFQQRSTRMSNKDKSPTHDNKSTGNITEPSRLEINREDMYDSERPEDSGDDVTAPDDFICPITQQVFRDPVQDLFGHTYERAAILSWLSRNGTCPMTRKPMRASELIPNVLMKTKVRLWQREHGLVPRHAHQHKDHVLSHLYETDDSEDEDDTDRDNQEEDTVLVGYWSMADTVGDERPSRFRRGRRQSARSTATNNESVVVAEDRPVFFFMESHGGNPQSIQIPPLDMLLAEYDHIIQEEEEEAMTRQNRQERRQQTSHPRRVRHASRSANEINPHEQQNNETENGPQEHSLSESHNVSSKSHLPVSRVRNFLFPRKAKNLGMVASAC